MVFPLKAPPEQEHRGILPKEGPSRNPLASCPEAKTLKPPAHEAIDPLRKPDISTGSFQSPPIVPILILSGLARSMEINALVISGLDPGAIPGGSTNILPGYRREVRGRSASTDV